MPSLTTAARASAPVTLRPARTLLAVTLVPANVGSSYPKFGERSIEVQYADVAVTRKHADAWLVIDSNDVVLGAVFSWDDGSPEPWTFVRARETHCMPEDTSHMSDAQHRGWAETCSADVQVLADAAAEDVARKAEGKPLTRRVLTRASMQPGRTRSECLNRAGMAVVS